MASIQDFSLTHTSGFLHLIHNDMLPAAQLDSAFRSRYDRGIVFFRDLFIYLGNTFISFETLHKNFTLPQVYFLRYLQAHSSGREHFPFPRLFDNDLLVWNIRARSNP